MTDVLAGLYSQLRRLKQTIIGKIKLTKRDIELFEARYKKHNRSLLPFYHDVKVPVADADALSKLFRILILTEYI